MTAPVRLDTVTLSDDFDFDRFFRSVLAGEPVIGSLPTDSSLASWWARAWPIIESGGYAARVLEAVNRCVADPDPTVRREALALLEDHPKGISTSRIAELLKKHRTLFEGVKDPYQGSIDLRWSLLRLLGAKMGDSDDDARDAVKLGEKLALEDSSSVQPLIAGLASDAPDWTAENAATLAKAAPGVVGAILYNFQRLGRDVRDVGKRMAAAVSNTKRFHEEVKDNVDDEAIRREILAGLRGKH
jgi:hypothetical protein